MIGNDVVDLCLAARESNWRRIGFLEKVFSEAEQEIITSSENQSLAVWLLWSMKEAAYKAHQRKFHLTRRLNWLVQQCEILHKEQGKASGIVKINDNIYKTTSVVSLEYIYTSAQSANISGVKNAIFKAPSSEAKNQLFQEVLEYFKVPCNELKLKKDEQGLPFFSSNDSFLFNRFSLSGHGRFSAYNLSLINCETSVKHS
ncbi:4'-phosphopantetheinyl transferase superfamily protein [Salinimicrobium xinjiangense]|uniref:4'-phosphopantetheinyl transferase superfamily protein n=1 Tax=Salinimicrobium xinjiangense TaxID=438596 RepID=UPI000418E106|nr:4'-phosphopantetheinyl transferase superfamily protein [Salinimicrobium xinjiangense]